MKTLREVPGPGLDNWLDDGLDDTAEELLDSDEISELELEDEEPEEEEIVEEPTAADLYEIEKDDEQRGNNFPTNGTGRHSRRTAYPFKQPAQLRPRKATNGNQKPVVEPNISGFQGTPSMRPQKPKACPRCSTSELILTNEGEGPVFKCWSCGYATGPRIAESQKSLVLFIEEEGKQIRHRKRQPSHGKQRL